MKTAPRIGILGGGQLARMLVQAAQKMGLDIGVNICVFVESLSSPAAQVAKNRIVGTVTQTVQNRFALDDFMSERDLVLFENEFMACDILADSAIEYPVEFCPSLSVIRRLQDKLGQKRVFEELGLLFASYEVLPPSVTSTRLMDTLNNFGDAVVLKWSKMGYDGYGNFIYSNSEQTSAALAFCQAGEQKGAQIFAEKKIRFKQELALVSCRSQSGEQVHYPLVITEQKEGSCHRVLGPATQLGVRPELEKMAQEYAEKIAKKLSMVGVFAIELFETDAGLIVNEVAPRVHNSGHFTLDAAQTSQFENHLLAVLGRGLGSVETAPYFAMLNLLAPAGARRAIEPQVNDPVFLHWYGKEKATTRRKMGHLNIRADTHEEWKTRLDQLTQIEANWFQESLKDG